MGSTECGRWVVTYILRYAKYLPSVTSTFCRCHTREVFSVTKEKGGKGRIRVFSVTKEKGAKGRGRMQREGCKGKGKPGKE